MAPLASPSTWEPPPPGELARWPLPHQSPLNAWVVRALALLARQQVLTIHGLEHVHPTRDPFILALNHSTMVESLLVPALLVLHRGGQLIHFLADWNYRLIPGIGLIYRRAETITVTRKPARPRVFNLFKPLYRHPQSVLERTRAHLVAGRSVGIFPEGTVNRDPHRLLPAHRGAALLSLRTGVPVVPVGIRFPNRHPDHPISDRALMEVRIGTPLVPTRPLACQSLAELHEWHAILMSEIARLCGKTWTPKPAPHQPGDRR